MKVFGRKRFEAGMDAELRFHLDAYVEDLVRGGLDRVEAQRQARAEFGDLEAKKDECREAGGYLWMDELGGDVRLTVRMLARHRGFAAVAILSLALGIGANTAVFGLVDAVLLRTLPVREPNRLVFVQAAGTEGVNGGPPYPAFELVRDHAASFDGVAAFSASSMELVIDTEREQVRGLWVSGNFYDVLGVAALKGRALAASDDRIVGVGGSEGAVAVISEAYWWQRFGGDPAAVGRTVRMAGGALTIVGVMPSAGMSVEPGRPIDIAVPMMLSNPDTLRDRGDWWLDVVARLRPGVHGEQARAETDALFQGYMSDLTMPPAIRRLSFDHIELTPAARGLDGLRRQYATALRVLLVLAALVLLAACANVANLMLARATAREREFAVRLAIGAGRGRLVRQTLAEAMVLVGAGSVLGIGLALQAQRALAACFAAGNRQIVLDLSLNARVLLYTVAIGIVTGVAFALAPALRAAGADPAAGLQGTSRSVTGGRRSLRLGRALTVLQVALSMVLLAGAGLFVRTLERLHGLDLGFAAAGVLTMEVAPDRALFGTPAWLALQQHVLDRVRALPGVGAASWSTMSPFSGRYRGSGFFVPGVEPADPRATEVHLLAVSPEYFDAFAVRLAAGRVFTAGDDATAPKVVIVNETAARFYFGERDPIGQLIGLSRGQAPDRRIVGVVRDARHDSLRAEVRRSVYVPIPQSVDRINRLALTVRGAGDVGLLAGPVQEAIHAAGSNLLVTNVATLQQQVDRALLTERVISAVAVVFGGVALALACIGLYGLLAYAVARRTRELGVRLALGATRGGVIWLVLREALILVAAGGLLGMPVIALLGGFARSLLFGVAPFDLPSVMGAVLLLLVFAVLAASVPAALASRLDPMTAVRGD